MQHFLRYVQKLSIVYVWSLLVFLFMKSKSILQVLQYILGYLLFLGSVDIGGYLIVALFKRWILTLNNFSDVFSDLQIVHTRAVYHTILKVWTMFHLRVFIIDIYKKCKSNPYLPLLVIFHDLRMIEFWAVKYIYLAYKLKFLLRTFYLWQICCHCIWNCCIWNCTF